MTILQDLYKKGVGEHYQTPTDIDTKATAQKNDPSGTPSGFYSHGESGIFNIPRGNNAIVSTVVAPRGGVLDVVPVLSDDPYDDRNIPTNMFGSRLYNFDTILTGVTEGDIETFANQPTDECATGPTGGLTKLCTIVNTMGNYKGSTREVALYRAGQALDRLDERTFRLLNSAQSLQQFFGVPSDMPAQNAIVANEMSRRLFELLLPFRRFFSRQVWSGNPANNNGEARQVMGLELHINEGNKVDFQSSAICDAADSQVFDFNYDRIDGTGKDVVEALEDLEYTTRVNNNRRGLSPVDGVLVMREAAFQQLSGVMPVKQYNEVLAALATQQAADRSRIMINATDAQAQRNQYRNDMFLPLNGRNYQVVIDDGIPEENSTNSANVAAGEFASDIYFLPLQVMGGMPASFFQGFNHDNMQAQSILERVAPNTFTFTSDGGLFRWNINYKDGCLAMNFQFSPWLKVKFPMCGFRLTNVRYTAQRRSVSPYPDSDYFANGGVTSQDTSDSFYTPWSVNSPINI